MKYLTLIAILVTICSCAEMPDEPTYAGAVRSALAPPAPLPEAELEALKAEILTLKAEIAELRNQLNLATVDMVDINAADTEQLDTLPGVGTSTAQAIIEYRIEHNGFSAVTELNNVAGIGDKKFENLVKLVYCGVDINVSTDLLPPMPPPVNINTASAVELQSLPGIGVTYAARIVAYRDEHGSFVSISDLVNVKGIGAKTVAKLLPYCEV